MSEGKRHMPGDQASVTESAPTPILLVDDNPANLIALASILDSSTYEIVTALSGPEALRRLMDIDFAVLLLDVRMPGMDGFELARTIKQRERTRHTPIVFLTAEASDLAQITEGYASGAVDYIQKPLFPEVVRAKVAVFVSLYQKEKHVRQQADQLLLKEQAERRTQLTALQHANERKLRDLIEAIPQLLWIADPDGTILMHNRRWLDYSGLPADLHHSPEKLTSVLHPEDVPRYWESWEMAREGGEIFESESRLLRKRDNTYRWHLCRAVPARGENGQIEQWLGTFTDIHVQKTADVMKEEFLATLSHELRTPLNVILGWVNLLQAGGAPLADLGRVLEIIERNTHIQIRLINDLLDLSRIITGKLHLEPRAIAFEDVVLSALGSLELIARNKNVTLSLAREEGVSYVIYGDANRLQQAVWNILSNAIKYTPRGGVVVASFRQDANSVTLLVRDSGEGIAAEFLPFLFDRFRQEDSSTTRAHGGLGLGLAIVKQLVESHGGKVTAHSAGKSTGSTFCIELPLYEDLNSPMPRQRLRTQRGASAHSGHESGEREDGGVGENGGSDGKSEASAWGSPGSERRRMGASATDESAEASESVTGPGRDLENVSVLLVDDSPDTLELLKTLLRAKGASVTTAGRVSEALEELRCRPPQVVVSDIGLPEENGYVLIRRLRAMQERGELPADVGAVALTAYAREEDRRLALESGFHFHLTKPVDPERLVQVVATLAAMAVNARSTQMEANA